MQEHGVMSFAETQVPEGRLAHYRSGLDAEVCVRGRPRGLRANPMGQARHRATRRRWGVAFLDVGSMSDRCLRR